MAMAESQVPAPASLDACGLADWAEAVMLAEDRNNSSRSFLRGRLRSSVSTGDDELEIQLDMLLSEVDRRKKRAEAIYPFAWSESGLSRTRDVDEAPYEFLLWLAVSPHYRQQKAYGEIEELFDNLVKQALIEYLGPNALGARFGSPASGERPGGFPSALKWLAGQLGLQTGAAKPRRQLKDGGVDVVVWNPFRDQRTGFVVILCQCTVAYDWTPKAKDIVAGNWNGWIDFGRDPLTAIAVPFAVPHGFDQWDELRRTVNIILDRMRIAELIDINAVDDLAAIQAWNGKERSFLSSST